MKTGLFSSTGVVIRSSHRRNTMATTAATLLFAPLVLFAILLWDSVKFGVPGLAAETAPSSVLSEARIRIVLPSLAEVENKLKGVIELSPDPHLRKQWRKLKFDLIDAYTDGVDEKHPLSVDLVFPATDLSYDFRIPISVFSGEKNGFLEGLRGRSLKTRKLSDGTYELIEKGKAPARMLFDKGYAWIATGGRPVPTKPPLATIDLMPTLALRKDIVAELNNVEQGIQLRRANFQTLRTRWEGRRRIRRGETANAFELRKVLQRGMLNEVERFLFEAQHVLVTGTIETSTSRRFGRGEISLAALPGTDLFKLIEQCGSKPGYFANVTLHEDPIAVSKLCVPLDSIRIDELKEMSKSLRPILETEIRTRVGPQTDSQRQSLIDAMNAMLDMMEEGTQLRSVDAFVNLFPSGANKSTLVCGVRTVNGKRGDAIIKFLQGFRSDWKVEFNAHDIAGVNVHEVTVGNQDLTTFQRIFDGQMLYVGTSPDAVWAAVGAESLNHLKVAIQQTTNPAPEKVEPVVLSYQLHPEKLVSLVEALQAQDSSLNTPLTVEERQTRKLTDKYFKLAHQAMSACDSAVVGELKRVDHKLEGVTEVNECTLKWIGSVIASLVKELE